MTYFAKINANNRVESSRWLIARACVCARVYKLNLQW